MGYLYGDGVRIRAPRGTYRPHPIFLCMVGIFVATGVLAWQEVGNDRFNVFLFVVFGWLVSVCLHEYAHALVGLHAGDRDVIHRGYLQLNPLKYAHPLLTFVLPVVFIVFAGFGLPGGAVLIDRSQVRRRWQESAISLAGPAVNLLFSVGLMLPFVIGVDPIAHPVFWSAVALLAYFQVAVLLLNLLPVPGLDGGNALFPWLSYDWKRGFNAVRPYGFLIIVVLLWRGPVHDAFFTLVDKVLHLGNVDQGLIALGYAIFQFWR
jgi:Zn-dependent protease